jgi:ABC-2 type transport system ATP-binding protein
MSTPEGAHAQLPRYPGPAGPRMGGAAIVVRALRKRFGAKEAVAGIDLEVAAGSLAGLVGPNGAGKTTSLSMMTGLLRPDSGQILINGIDVWKDPPAAKAAIGVVPAEARLFDRLSGEELLEYAGRLRGLPAGQARSRAAQLLDVLDLAGDARRLVADYSTGMRKKAALGCALIHNPPVLFLDEPLEGVDPVRRVRLDGAVLQSRHGTGRAGLRPRIDHRQGQDRGDRHHRRGSRRQDTAAGVHRPGGTAGDR